MNKADRTRRFIIERTAAIFNTKGYAGTTVSDLTNATGLTKGSIYGNFANKDEVALAVFEYNSKALGKRFDAALADKKTPTERLFGAVEYYQQNWAFEFSNGGCPILNASVEADDNLPFMKKKVQQSLEIWARKLELVITSGQHTGEFKSEINSAAYAFTMITLIEGGIMLGKITNDENHLFTALNRIIKIINEEIIR